MRGAVVPSILDQRLVSSRVRATAKARGISESRAFIPIVLQALFRLTETEVNDCITDGGNDQGIDAIHIEAGPQPIVHLLNCRYRESEARSASRNFPSAELSKLYTFLDLVISGVDRSEDQLLNPDLADKVQYVEKLLNEGAPVSFVVHLSSNGLPLQPKERELFLERIRPFKHVRLSEIGLAELASLLSQRKPQGDEVKLRLSSAVHSQKSYSGILNVNSIVCSVSADQIVEFVRDKANPDKVNWDVFAQNLRGFLGITNDVNDRVFRTAVGDEHFKFWYLNNGIAIVCQDFRIQPKRDNPVVSLIDPQIVNGCQTTNVLFEVGRDHPERLRDIEVMVRIYSTNDEQMRSEIAQATNTQTRITARDLRSNDLVQEKIEAALATYGFQYVRKMDGSTQETPNRIEPLRLGQVVVAALHGEPDHAITRSDDILAGRYAEIFNDRLDVGQLVPLLRTLETIERMRTDRPIRGAPRVRLANDRSLAYASFHLLFIMKRLADSEGRSLAQETFNEHFDRAIGIVNEVMKENRQLSNYELFRSPRTRERILARLQLGTVQMSLSLS